MDKNDNEAANLKALSDNLIKGPDNKGVQDSINEQPAETVERRKGIAKGILEDIESVQDIIDEDSLMTAIEGTKATTFTFEQEIKRGPDLCKKGQE